MARRFKSDQDKPDSEKVELSEEELRLQKGRTLPDRAAMSTLDADVAIPINPELAADVLSGMDAGEDEEPGEPEDL